VIEIRAFMSHAAELEGFDVRVVSEGDLQLTACGGEAQLRQMGAGEVVGEVGGGEKYDVVALVHGLMRMLRSTTEPGFAAVVRVFAETLRSCRTILYCIVSISLSIRWPTVARALPGNPY
jgi:hypothetical protein